MERWKGLIDFLSCVSFIYWSGVLIHWIVNRKYGGGSCKKPPRKP